MTLRSATPTPHLDRVGDAAETAFREHNNRVPMDDALMRLDAEQRDAYLLTLLLLRIRDRGLLSWFALYPPMLTHALLHALRMLPDTPTTQAMRRLMDESEQLAGEIRRAEIHTATHPHAPRRTDHLYDRRASLNERARHLHHALLQEVDARFQPKGEPS